MSAGTIGLPAPVSQSRCHAPACHTLWAVWWLVHSVLRAACTPSAETQEAVISRSLTPCLSRLILPQVAPKSSAFATGPRGFARACSPTPPAGFQDLWGPAAVVPEAEQLAGLGHLPGHLLRQRRPLPAGGGADPGRRVRLRVSSETSGTPRGPGSACCSGSARCSPQPQAPTAAGAAVGLIRDLPACSSQVLRPCWCCCNRLGSLHYAVCSCFVLDSGTHSHAKSHRCCCQVPQGPSGGVGWGWGWAAACLLAGQVSSRAACSCLSWWHRTAG